MSVDKRPPPPAEYDENPEWTPEDFARARRHKDGAPFRSQGRTTVKGHVVIKRNILKKGHVRTTTVQERSPSTGTTDHARKRSK